jgi:hypothetical protein
MTTVDEDKLDKILVTLQTQQTALQTIIPAIQTIIPVVVGLQVERNNLWRGSVMSTVRDEKFRKDLLTALGYTAKKRKNGYPCMVSKLLGNGDNVLAAHIAPAVSEVKRLNSIGLTEDDVNNPRNGLLLAYGIEKCFDNLRLSFVKSNPLSTKLYMKIWDDSCRHFPLWHPNYDSENKTVGDYDGCELDLKHSPFKRALSYQAYMSYLTWKHVGVDEPKEYVSENNSSYFTQRCLADNFERDMTNELPND